MSDPTVITVSAAKLFVQKLIVGFLIGFLPMLAATLTGAMQEIIDSLSSGGGIDFAFFQAIGISILTGALTALTRAILALVPGINLVASDKLHTLGKKRPIAVKAEGRAP